MKRLKIMEHLCKRHPLPLELRDACANMAKWMRLFHNCQGIIILLLVIKLPVAKKLFVKSFRQTKKTFSGVKRIVVSLQGMAKDLQNHRSELVAEIDNATGPMLPHGCASVLMDLGVVTRSQGGTLLLGIGNQQ